MITAVGVVVPAHNEAGRVGACLESIKVALAALPSNVDSAIWVMVDRSTDGTLRIVEASLAGRPRWGGKAPGKSAPLDGSGIEEPAAVLNLLRPHPARDTWLLHTDADSKVPSDWVVRHLRHAEDGAQAVAGVVRLDDLGHLHPRAAHRYEVLVNAERETWATRKSTVPTSAFEGTLTWR